MLPPDANNLGNVFGGVVMALVDKTAAVAAIRHARSTCVTASIDRVDFREPIHLGDLVVLKASVNYVGRTSMEVGVRVEAEDLITGVRRAHQLLLPDVRRGRRQRAVRGKCRCSFRRRKRRSGVMQRRRTVAAAGSRSGTRKDDARRHLTTRHSSHGEITRNSQDPTAPTGKSKSSRPGSSNAMVVFRHPDARTTGLDRYAWYITQGAEAHDVTARLDKSAVLDSLRRCGCAAAVPPVDAGLDRAPRRRPSARQRSNARAVRALYGA